MTATTAMLAVAALGLGAPSYESQLQRAERVTNLGRYLETYVGDCLSDDPGFDKKACLAKAKAVQKEKNGKLVVFDVQDVAEVFQLRGFDKKRGGYRVELTPFFPDRHLALSVGKPKKFNKDGLPVVRNLPLVVKMPEGETEFTFRRRLERGMLRVEVIFKPTGAWAVRPTRGGDIMQGVAMRVVGVRISDRSNAVLAEETY